MPQHQAESHSQKPTKNSLRRRRRIHRRKNAALPSRKSGSGGAAYWILFFDSLGVRITSVGKIGLLHLFCSPLARCFQLFGNCIFRNFSSQKPCIKRENTARKCGVVRCCIFWQHNLVRREGFEPPAFWSVGCLTHKSESFQLRFVLFTTIRSADFPLFPSSPARFFRVLGQNWVRSCREDKRRYRSRQKNLPQIPKNEKAFAPHVRVRCIILSYGKRAKTRAGRSNDISGRNKYISCS